MCIDNTTIKTMNKKIGNKGTITLGELKKFILNKDNAMNCERCPYANFDTETTNNKYPCSQDNCGIAELYL